MTDSPNLQTNLDAKMFFESILGFEFDEKSGNYIYSDINNLVKTAKIIQDTFNFFRKREFTCDLDNFSQRILNDSTNSDENFFDSRLKGLEIKNQQTVSLQLPEHFKRKLKPYQEKSVKHLAEVGYAANFSVPGSGKTTITYATYSIWKNSNIVEKIMVVGPRSSFMPWEEEFEECFEKEYDSLRLSGSVMDNLVKSAAKQELILCTYQLMSLYTDQIIDLLSKYKILLVLDESHHAKRLEDGLWSSSVLKIAPYAARRAILSGTPMPNSARDLWTQLTFLWPYKNLLGESESYKRKVKDGLGEYLEKIKPFYIRITKDALDLKKPNIKEQLVPLRQYQQKIYDTIAMKTLEEIESLDERSKLHIWRRNKIIRLLQAASNPSLLNEYSIEFKIPPLSGEGLPISTLIENYSKHEVPSKLSFAANMAKDLMKSGEKVIIWTAFVHNIITLENELLKEEKPIVIYGDVPKDENENEEENREKRIQEFKNDPNPRVLIANPSSLSESVSLHKNEEGKLVCQNAIYIDRTFDAGQYMQSLDRIHRIGLEPETEVNYILLIGENTVDAVVNERLKQKMTTMYEALDDDIGILNLESSIENISDKKLDEDFQRVYDYLKKRKGELNANQPQRD